MAHILILEGHDTPIGSALAVFVSNVYIKWLNGRRGLNEFPRTAGWWSMAVDVTVLAMFTDVRGFTRWSEANEVFVNLERFVTGFLGILRTRFPAPRYQIKPLGDGALIISELPEGLNQRDLAAVLSKTLNTIRRVEADFTKHCQSFSREVGHSSDLHLGWGIVRGKVMKVADDWAGHNLNKCSRLCNEARPFGVVVDRDDFPELPSRDAKGFVAQIRRLQGIGEVRVWATAEVASQYVPREKIRETPEVHVAGTCIMEDGAGRFKILVARRMPTRSLYPDKLEGCGGQLRYSESFTAGVKRHFRQELGLDVEVIEDLHVFYEIREPDVPLIPGIRFLCRRVSSAEPHSSNHSEVYWMSETQFRNHPADEFVGTLKIQVLELLRIYKEGLPRQKSKRA